MLVVADEQDVLYSSFVVLYVTETLPISSAVHVTSSLQKQLG